MNEIKRVLVAGAGGFIGGHLTGALLNRGYVVRAVDIKPISQWHQVFPSTEGNWVMDLSEKENCRLACDFGSQRCDRVYQLAADMGGIGFIESHRADCILNALINLHLLMAARDCGAERFFYAGSACCYAAQKQINVKLTGLKEEDAWPAQPERGYGLEKLFSEEAALLFREDYGLETRCARFHNIYGKFTDWTGGREKAPAAICRKVAEAVISGRHEISIWGDGSQKRSFCWVADCVEGICRLTDGDWPGPVNIGSSEMVTVSDLVSIVEQIAGITLVRKYDLSAPMGVQGRSSDNTLIKEKMGGWEPFTRLRDGLAILYPWVYDQVRKSS